MWPITMSWSSFRNSKWLNTSWRRMKLRELEKMIWITTQKKNNAYKSIQSYIQNLCMIMLQLISPSYGSLHYFVTFIHVKCWITLAGTSRLLLTLLLWLVQCEHHILWIQYNTYQSCWFKKFSCSFISWNLHSWFTGRPEYIMKQIFRVDAKKCSRL